MKDNHSGKDLEDVGKRKREPFEKLKMCQSTVWDNSKYLETI